MEFLVRLEDKNDNPAGSKKGDFITYKPDGWTWGTEELKLYGIARIDCTEGEAAQMCESETEMVYDEKLKMELPVIKIFRKRKLDIDRIKLLISIDSWLDKSKYSKVITAEKI